jgi:hypothetical protein
MQQRVQYSFVLPYKQFHTSLKIGSQQNHNQTPCDMRIGGTFSDFFEPLIVFHGEMAWDDGDRGDFDGVPTGGWCSVGTEGGFCLCVFADLVVVGLKVRSCFV